MGDGDSAELRFEDGSHVRSFCTVRYAHSRHLPEAIRSAARGKAHFGNKRSPYLIARDVPGANGPYAIYFAAIKATKPSLHVVIDVRSAHIKPNLPDNLPSIGFATIIGLTAAGRPINRPKK